MANGRLGRFLALVILVALLSGAVPVLSQVSPQAVKGTFDSSGITVAGPARVVATSLHAFGMNSATQTMSGTIQVMGSQLVVNETHEACDSYGVSATGNAGLYGRCGPDDYRERAYINASLSGVATTDDANLMVVGLSEQVAATLEGVPHSQHWTSPGVTWFGGQDNQNDAAIPGGDAAMTYRTRPPPESILVNMSTPQSVRVDGTFAIYVWGLNLTLTDTDGGRGDIASGTWLTNQTGTDVHPYGLTRQRHSQLVRVTVTNGSFLLFPTSGVARLAAGALSVDSEGVATYEDASGVLLGETGRYDARGRDVTLAGELHHDVAASGDDHRPLRATIRGQASTVSLPAEPGALASVTHSNAASWPWLWLLPALAAVMAPAGLIAVRHFRSRLPGDLPADMRLAVAHAALQEGNVDEAARQTAILRKSHPRDPDVQLLQGAILVKQRRFQEALPLLLGVARAMDGVHHIEAAFMITHAYANLGQRKPARKWAREAALDPVVLERMRGDAAFADLLDWESIRRSSRIDAAYS